MKKLPTEIQTVIVALIYALIFYGGCVAIAWILSIFAKAVRSM